MLNCKEVLARHSEYIDGEMTPADAERWRAHVAACPLCARYDRVLRRGISLVSSINELEPGPEFLTHLRFRLGDEQNRMTMRLVSNGAAAGVSIAAVLALIVWVPLMLMSGGRNVSTVRVNALESGIESAEIAWHGDVAVRNRASHLTLSAPPAAFAPTHSTVWLASLSAR
ncbi:MAG: zf-HC2 domain-containing protein [Gemmatimonadota bacterium]